MSHLKAAACAAAITALLMFPAVAAEPSAPIKVLNDALMAAEKNGAKPFPERYKALTPAVDSAFDLQQILKTSVGLKWSGLSADQQKKLFTVFRAYTISSYAANFNSDSGDTFRILPETRDSGADKIVETEIVPKQGDAIRIDYVMRATNGAWQAVDVLQQGTISQAAVQRSDFRGLLTDGADKLVASLQEKVSTMSGGTITP